MPSQLAIIGAGGAGAVANMATSGLIFWGDAGQESYIDNDLVTNMVDWNFVSTDLTAAGAARPTFKTNQINGRPALLFNGTATTLGIASWTPTLSGGMTIMAVVSALTGVNFANIVSARKADLSNFNELRMASVATYAQFIATDGTGAASDLTNVVNNAGYKILTGRRTDSPARNYFSVYPNTPVDVAGGAGTDVVDTISVGSRGASLYFNGYIAEWLVYSRPLSAYEILGNQLYLKAKYAL
jgi:hypothetical protein